MLSIFRVRFAPIFVFVPVLCALGVWQLQRAEEKRQLSARLDIASSYEEASPSEVAHLDDIDGRWLRLNGYFDNEHIWYLDNRIHKGRVGYEVIVPFRDQNGWLLLLNRGFWQGDSRRTLPSVQPVHGKQSLRVRVYQPSRMPLVLRADTPQTNWPQLIQSADVQLMWDTLALAGQGYSDLKQWQLFPHMLRLGADQAGAQLATWHGQTPWLSAERHVGYAMTWFSLATVLLLMNIWHVLRR